MKNVFFLPIRNVMKKSLVYRFKKFLPEAGIDFIKQGSQVLLKTHFGEEGNFTFLSPLFVRAVSDYVHSCSAHPFAGDTSTLYRGDRKRAVTHQVLALEHGFDYTGINAPVIILDGLKGDYFYRINIDGKHFTEVQLAGGFVAADSALILTHVKGHGNTGIGGAIKNLSMGLGTRTQKQRMHADVKPVVVHEKCILCNECIRICPVETIKSLNQKIDIGLDSCIGCAECITHCPTNAIQILWNESSKNLAEKMVETALAAVKSKEGKIFYINFLLNITPDCDCFGYSCNPVVNNLGILFSDDPVAIDKASYDLINSQKPLPNSVLENSKGRIFDCLHGGCEALHQVKYGAKMGLGSPDYKIIEL